MLDVEKLPKSHGNDEASHNLKNKVCAIFYF